MKKLSFSFLAGVVATLGYLAHLGPEFLIGTGVRWQAAQREYVVYSEAAPTHDETGVAEILAERVKAPRKVAKR